MAGEGWGTETSVIRHIHFTGKWVEIWCTHHADWEPDGSWNYCSKSYILDRAIDEAGLRGRVQSHGYVGLGVVREKFGCTLEIVRVFDAADSL